jgi:hypothetical protein
VQFLTLLRASDAHAHVHRSWRTCTPCADRLRQALALYRGNFLADFFIPDSSVFEKWASLQREHLLQRALSALERVAEWAQWRGLYSEAIEYVRRQVTLEPLLEVNQRVFMRLLVLNGEVTAALTHYRQLERMLAQELQAEPEEATTTLFDQIRQGDTAGLRQRQPPFAVPARPRISLAAFKKRKRCAPVCKTRMCAPSPSPEQVASARRGWRSKSPTACVSTSRTG